MREIKFRVWHKKEKKMFYTWAGWFMDLGGDFVEYLGDDDGAYLVRSIKEDVELMQYTGLKDKTGKEIYEGDILRSEIEEYGGEVIFENGQFGVKDKVGTRLLHIPGIKDEIIGNIYENPELDA